MFKQSPVQNASRLPEARQSPRRRLALAAQISVGSNQSIAGQIDNISASGAFVRGHGVTPELGAVVQLELQCYRQGKPLTLRMSATVVRVEADGVALRFGRYDSIVYTELIDMIYDLERVA